MNLKKKDLYDGMKVTCSLSGTKIDDATISYKGKGHHIFVCQNVKSGSSCTDKKGYQYSWTIGSVSATGYEGCTNLKAKSGDINNLVIGDIITKGGSKYRIASVAEGVVGYMSVRNTHGSVSWVTKGYFASQGYTIDKPVNPAQELTVAEISKKLGYDVKVVK